MRNHIIVGYSVTKRGVELSSHRGYVTALRRATFYAGATMIDMDIKRIFASADSKLTLTDYQNKVDGFTVL